MRATRRRGREGRRARPRSPQRLPAAARTRRAGRPAERPRADRHGRRRLLDARARRALRLVWTYAGGLARRRAAVARRHCSTSTASGASTDATEVYGLVGAPVGHSVSPAMHNAAFRATRLDAVYLPLPAADADDFVSASAARSALKGASVTIPFKVALFERSDEVYSVARRIGAINTIRVRGRTLARRATPTRAGSSSRFAGPDAARRAAGLGPGAGGAARAVAVALASAGAARHACTPAKPRRRPRTWRCCIGGRVGPWPPAPRQLGPARQLHADRHAPASAGRQPDRAGRSDGPAGVRPRLQPAGHAAAARRGGGRLPDDRRPRHARGAGAGAVPVVDRRPAAGRRDAGGRAQAAGGVHAR